MKRRTRRALLHQLSPADLTAAEKDFRGYLSSISGVRGSSVDELLRSYGPEALRRVLREFLLNRDIGLVRLEGFLQTVLARGGRKRSNSDDEAGRCVFMLVMDLQAFGLSKTHAASVAEWTISKMRDENLLGDSERYLRQLDDYAWAAYAAGRMSSDEETIFNPPQSEGFED